jgi:hypothetical protein
VDPLWRETRRISRRWLSSKLLFSLLVDLFLHLGISAVHIFLMIGLYVSGENALSILTDNLLERCRNIFIVWPLEAAFFDVNPQVETFKEGTAYDHIVVAKVENEKRKL